MKEIDLVGKAASTHEEYQPVNLAEGVSITAICDVRDGVVSVEGTIDRNGKNLGRYTYNEDQNRMFINYATDDLERTTKLDILETVSSLINKIVSEVPVEQPTEE